jgi:glycosyltransferase involved in cell wall biosynthesis
VKATLVSGSYPPEICGIGHYSYHLARALEESGVRVAVESGPGWGAGRLSRLVGGAMAADQTILHIQYPSEGFGWSVAPQLLTVLVPSIVTLHELSRVGMLRKLSILPFLLAARKLIFTSDYELAYAVRRFPWIQRKSAVIEIGNNIPIPPNPVARASNEVTYFGLIVPKKGIEEVLRLASLAQQSGLPVRVRIVGATVPRFSEYASRLREQSEGLPVDLNFDLDDEATGQLLSGAAVAYLPFPDGASVRRGSLKALLACGTAVITTRGPQTTSPLDEAVLFAASPEEALKLSIELSGDPDRLSRIAARSVRYAETFGWKRIAEEHLEVYRQFAGQRRQL